MIDIIPSLGQAWQEWMTETILATALLMAIVIMIRRPVSRVFGPQIAYLLWLVPAARLFMPAFTQTIEVPVAMPAVTDNLSASAQVMLPAQTGPQVQEIASSRWFDGLAANMDLWLVLMTLWLGGAALFLVVQLGIYLQGRAEILRDGREIDQIGDIRVVEVAGIAGPFAFGIISRYIAVPLGFRKEFTPNEQVLALQHELAHHEARDIWANLVALILLSLHWFNPIAWMAYRFFRFDQEAACDARVLSGSDDGERMIYGRMIARLTTGRTLALASPLTPKEKLKERLAIMTNTKTSPLRRGLGVVLVSGMIGTALVATATVSQAYVMKPVVEVAIPQSDVFYDERVAHISVEGPGPEWTDIAAISADEKAKDKSPKKDKAKDKSDEVNVLGSKGSVIRLVDANSRSVIVDVHGDDGTDINVDICKGAKASRSFLRKVETSNGRSVVVDHATCGQLTRRADKKRRVAGRVKVDASAVTVARAPVFIGLKAPGAVLAKAEVARIHVNDAEIEIDEKKIQKEAMESALKALQNIDWEHLIPEMHFSEDCDNEGREVKTSSRNGRSVIALKLCGANELAEARAEALVGLRDARDDVASDDDIPEDIRKRILKALDARIKQLRRS